MSIIFQTLFALGLLGIIGFVLYWLGVVFKAGVKNVQDELDKDQRLK